MDNDKTAKIWAKVQEARLECDKWTKTAHAFLLVALRGYTGRESCPSPFVLTSKVSELEMRFTTKELAKFIETETRDFKDMERSRSLPAQGIFDND